MHDHTEINEEPNKTVPCLTLDAQGWVGGVQHMPSPNCDARPTDCDISLLVIHNISLPPGRFGGRAIEDLFLNRLDPTAHPDFVGIAALRVSAHFLIRRGGQIVQFVSCAQRAWHAGESSLAGRSRCNDFSVGIELEGTDFVAFTSAQYRALARLTTGLRRGLPLRAVRGHEHIAPKRKTDPGPCFDWRRYARQAHLPEDWLPA